MASRMIEAAYERTWWALVLRGILTLLIAVFIFWRPMDSIASLALVIALYALFSGSVQIVHAFQLRPLLPHWWALLVSGLIGVLFGIAAIYYYPALSLAYAVVVVTWWLLLTGGFAILAGIMERRLGMPGAWSLGFGILAILAGGLAIMNPPATLAAILGLIGGFALVSGVLLLLAAFRLSSAKAAVTGTLGMRAG